MNSKQMSEYVSMRSIKLKNTIMRPDIIEKYRSGNFDYNALQDVSSPLREIYTNTYNYIDYPELSEDAKNLISLTKPVNVSIPVPSDALLAKSIAKSSM